MDTLLKPSRVIGPEDVRVGDYITITHEVLEFFVCANATEYGQEPEIKLKRMAVMPYGAGRPYKVVSVCLPFVLVRTMTGERCTLDLRQHHIARINKVFGKEAFKKEKDEQKEKKRKKRKKKKRK